MTNAPEHWLSVFPWPARDGHKYDRGHAAVIGGGMAMTGAARLAATAALRLCGLATVVCPPEALPVYASALTSVMTAPMEKAADLPGWLKARHVRAILIGPGNGVDRRVRDMTLAALGGGIPCALDADALTVFAENPRELLAAIGKSGVPTVLTPHAGEFARLFGDIGKDRTNAACAAAKQSGAVVVLKGPETVIAAPDGQTAVNKNAPPWLATAGSGDALAGMLTGLLAGGMPAFEASCAAAWIHGECANILGIGLIAEELAAAVPAALRSLASGPRNP